jgi:hypothetical protein
MGLMDGLSTEERTRWGNALNLAILDTKPTQFPGLMKTWEEYRASGGQDIERVFDEVAANTAERIEADALRRQKAAERGLEEWKIDSFNEMVELSTFAGPGLSRALGAEPNIEKWTPEFLNRMIQDPESRAQAFGLVSLLTDKKKRLEDTIEDASDIREGYRTVGRTSSVYEYDKSRGALGDPRRSVLSRIMRSYDREFPDNFNRFDAVEHIKKIAYEKYGYLNLDEDYINELLRFHPKFIDDPGFGANALAAEAATGTGSSQGTQAAPAQAAPEGPTLSSQLSQEFLQQMVDDEQKLTGEVVSIEEMKRRIDAGGG